MRTNPPPRVKIVRPEDEEASGGFRFEYIRIEHGTRPLPWGEQAHWIPAVDVYGNEQAVVVEVHLPGIEPAETQIDFGGNWVRIVGRRRPIEISGRSEFFHVEIARGDFQRLITLPEGLRTQAAEATFELGLLKITIPWEGKAWSVACRTSRFPEEWS